MKTIDTILLSICLILSIASSTQAAPEDYNATAGYGLVASRAENPFYEVELTSASLASEVIEGDGRHRLAFNFQLRNIGGGYHGEVSVLLNAADTLPWALQTVSLEAKAADLIPASIASPSSVTTTLPLEFICAAADAGAVKTAILALQNIHPRSKELHQHTVPIHAADATMDAVFSTASGLTSITFTASTSSIAALQVNHLLVHNPDVYLLNTPLLPGGDVLQSHLVNLKEAPAAYALSKVQTKALKITAILIASDGKVTVSGNLVVIFDLVRDGISISTQLDGYRGPAARDPLFPPTGTSIYTGDEFIPPGNRGFGNAGPDATGFPQGALADLKGLVTLHYPLNDVTLAEGVTLDGEFLFRGMNIRFVSVKRSNETRKVAIRLSNHIEANLRLTVEKDVSILDKEKTILNAPLITIVIPVGQYPITIQPILKVKVGCKASVSTYVQAALVSSLDFGYDMAVDLDKPPGSQVQFDPISKVTPLETSKPDLSRALVANAQAWVEPSLDILIQNSVGPGIGARITADLTLAPFADPWWKLKTDFQLNGRFSLSLLGINLAQVNAPIGSPSEIFSKDPGGPHVPSPLTGPLDGEEGNETRWARALRWTNQLPNAARVCRVHGSPEDVFAVFNSADPATTLMRVNDRGDLGWARNIGERLSHIVCTQDGGVILGGSNGNILRLLKYDGNGTLIWQRQHSLTYTTLTTPPDIITARILIRETGLGGQELDIVGYTASDSLTLNRDPFHMRCDDAGNVLSTKIFNSANAIRVTDATYGPGNSIVYSGMLQFSPNGIDPPGSGILLQGWLMKASQLDVIDWSTAYQSFRGNQFNTVTVSPSGEIYTAGYLITVFDNYGSLQVTRHSSTGTLLQAATISEEGDPLANNGAAAPNYDLLINPATNPTSPGGKGITDWLPNTGKTSWDEGRRILWSNNGLVMVATSGLAANRAATITSLTENLSVRWHVAHERITSEEYLYDIIPTDDGLLAVGTSTSFLSFATGLATNTNSGMLLKLPLDGKCDLHPGTKSIHRYLQPGVHSHLENSEELGLFQPNMTSVPNIAAPLTTASATTVAASPMFAAQFTNTVMTHWIPLERGNATQAMTYNQWAAYWNLPANSPNADADLDGRTNSQEWFFGGDPISKQSSPQVNITKTASGLSFATTRSKAASGRSPIFQTSETLTSWLPLSTGTLYHSPIDLYTDQMSFDIAFPSDPKRFYRMAAP